MEIHQLPNGDCRPIQDVIITLCEVVTSHCARNAFAGQQTEEPQPEEHPVNLWEAADEGRDFGAHGHFDSVSRANSVPWIAVKHRKLIVAAVGTFAALGYAVGSDRFGRRHTRR